MTLLQKENHFDRLERRNGLSEVANTTSNEVFLILGFLGAGKTTLLKNIAEYFLQRKEAFKVIVNDIGKFNIDAERLKDLNPIELTQGCICCQDLASLKESLAQLKPTREKILIEPTGIADGKSIKRIISELGMQGRVITLVNAKNHANMQEAEAQIARTQLAIADVIGITHLSSSQEATQDLKNSLSERYPGHPVFLVPDSSSKEDLLKSDMTVDHMIDAAQQVKKSDSKREFSPALGGGVLQSQGGKRSVLLQKPVPEHHEHHKFFTQSIELSEAHASLSRIKEVITMLGDELLRMKGVLSHGGEHFEFDYVRGEEVKVGGRSELSPHINIITTHPLASDFGSKMTTLPTSQVESSNISEKKIFSPIEIAAAVNHLLQQYKSYMTMYKEKTALEAEYDNHQSSELAQKIQSLDIALDQLGDDMKFDNPLIWIGYKRLAYANDPHKKVGTIGELKKHCERKTDICHKRLDFLNEQLKSVFGIDLFDEEMVDSDQLLADFIKENDAIKKLCQDEAFMSQRLAYEHFQVDGKVAKWQNYQPVE